MRARLQAKVQVNEQGCWVWTGALTSHNSHGRGGYGRFKWDGREWLAHRAAYVLFKGPIPKGLTLDHVVCDNRACCNPAHVVPATHRANILRGNGIFAQNARKTHCSRGHAFTPENTGIQPGGRFCRTCRRADYRRYHATHSRTREEKTHAIRS